MISNVKYDRLNIVDAMSDHQLWLKRIVPLFGYVVGLAVIILTVVSVVFIGQINREYNRLDGMLDNIIHSKNETALGINDDSITPLGIDFTIGLQIAILYAGISIVMFICFYVYTVKRCIDNNSNLHCLIAHTHSSDDTIFDLTEIKIDPTHVGLV